ncbi:hypothetical protein D3C72_2517960 [compost metagenome]
MGIADTRLVQRQVRVGDLLRGDLQGVAPFGFRQVAIGGEHADVAAALFHTEFQLDGLTGA